MAFKIKLNGKYGVSNAGDEIVVHNKVIADQIVNSKIPLGPGLGFKPLGVIVGEVVEKVELDGGRPGGEIPPLLLARLKREGKTPAEIPALAALAPKDAPKASTPAPATNPKRK